MMFAAQPPSTLTKNAYGHRSPPLRLIRPNPYAALTVCFVDFHSSSKLATFPFLSAYRATRSRSSVNFMHRSLLRLQYRSVRLSRSPIHTSRLPRCGTVGPWERSGRNIWMCHGGNPLPSASLEGTMSNPTCRCVGVSLSTFLLSCARALPRSTPKNQSRKRIFESTFSKCA